MMKVTGRLHWATVGSFSVVHAELELAPSRLRLPLRLPLRREPTETSLLSWMGRRLATMLMLRGFSAAYLRRKS